MQKQNTGRKRKISFVALQHDVRNRQGWLKKQGGKIKTWKDRLFVLHENILYYFKSEKALQPKGCIKLNNALAEKIKQDSSKQICEPFGVKIHTEFRTFFVCSKDEQAIDDWLFAIQAAINLSSTQLKLSNWKIGWLYKEGGRVKNWKKRFFALRNGVLYYYKTDEENAISKGVIGLFGAKLKRGEINPSGHKYFFEIKNDLRTYLIYATSQEDLDEWLSYIQRVILEQTGYLVPAIPAVPSEGSQASSATVTPATPSENGSTEVKVYKNLIAAAAKLERDRRRENPIDMGALLEQHAKLKMKAKLQAMLNDEKTPFDERSVSRSLTSDSSFLTMDGSPKTISSLPSTPVTKSQMSSSPSTSEPFFATSPTQSGSPPISLLDISSIDHSSASTTSSATSSPRVSTPRRKKVSKTDLNPAHLPVKVSIGAGIFEENLEVREPLEVHGISPSVSIIKLLEGTSSILTVESHNVKFCNVTIMLDPESTLNHTIRVNSGSLTLENCVVIATPVSTCIHCTGDALCFVKGSELKKGRNGIFVSNDSMSIVSDSIISTHEGHVRRSDTAVVRMYNVKVTGETETKRT